MLEISKFTTNNLQITNQSSRKNSVDDSDFKLIDWISKLEVLGERNNNLIDQVLYLDILSEACGSYVEKDLKKIQKRIRIQLFNIGTNPMKRGVINFSLTNDEKSIVKIFKPPKLDLRKIIESNPSYEVCDFKIEDDNKFVGDLVNFSQIWMHNLTEIYISLIARIRVLNMVYVIMCFL